MKKFVVLSLFLILVACSPKVQMIERPSDMNPGISYSVVYVKKGFSGVCTVDRYKNGNLIAPGNTVTLDGLNLLQLAPKPGLLIGQ